MGMMMQVPGAGGGGYVDRGDPGTYDYSQATWSTTGAWTDQDLSGIVPAGAKAVLLRLELRDAAVGTVLKLRENGNSNDSNAAQRRILVADQNHLTDMVVACDSNRVIEYYLTAAFDWIRATVAGWWL